MSLWSSVDARKATSPVKLVSTTGDEITLDSLLRPIQELQNGHFYWNKLPLFNGHLQTFKASAKNFGADVQHYGRRVFNWGNGSISVDYAVPKDESADRNYAPIEGVPRPFPLNTRYLTEKEIEEKDDSSITRPLLISVHGLAGGAIEPYIRSTLCEMQKGAPSFEHCVITSRGCNRSYLSTPQFFNACWTDDLRNLVNHVAEVQPKRPIYLVGYSLGGAIVANYLGQEAEKTKVTGACVVSAPWNLDLTNYIINSSFMGKLLYNRVMGENLSRLTSYNGEILKNTPPYSTEWARITAGTKTILEYDTNFTAKAFGFDSAEDYYRHASPVNRLRHIRTPCLVLGAKDDPICADANMPYLELAANPFMHTVTTTSGGHLGWFQADGTKWSSKVISEFFKTFNDQVDLHCPPVRIPPQVRWFNGDRFGVKPEA